MNYKIFEVEPELNKYISLKLGEHKYKTFQASNEEPAYISFLRQLSEENPEDSHYQEWLSQGNTLEDFWNQDIEV